MTDPLSKLADDLSPKQRRLLELMLKNRERAGEAGRKESIPKRSPADPLVLSFAQQRLWFIEQFQPGTAAYNIPSGVRLHGPLDAALFQESLRATVRRHEALRTTFVLVGAQPLQVIAPRLDVKLPLVDVRALPASWREAEGQRVINGLARRSFDMAAAPPWRAVLVRLAADDHIFLAVMHHALSDTWTTGVFFREMVGHYKAFAEGRASSLRELPIQYADYAVWQRRSLEGGELKRQLEYWKSKFEGAPPLLELPTDRPRPAVQSFRGGRVKLVLPNTLTDRLKTLSGERDATFFMTLMAGFQTLLFRYSGQEDVLVGTPVANRDRVELENLLGLFVNTLVLRTRFDGAPSFEALLAQVRETTLEALSNHDVPFERVVDELTLERDTSRNPLFQVIFAFQNVPIPKLVAEGLTLERYEFHETTARLDLELDLQEMPFGFVGWIGYNADLFDGATVERMARCFRRLFESAADDVTWSVAEMPLLGEGERHQLLLAWNDTGTDRPARPLIHEMFAAHARQRPEATAIATRERRLTYGEVEAKANRLAHHLRGLGVGPEVLVAVCMDRTTPERAVATVAVLKAGGAYVPLDPAYPPERLGFLLEDAQAAVLLTEQRIAEVLPATGAAVICLDGGWDGIHGDEATPPESGVAPENLSYVVYTSGSTGQPKGVQIPHAGLLNLVRWHQELYGVAPGDRGTQVASPAFDAAVWELWPHLAGGASLHVPDEETRLSAAGMVRWWAEEGITLAYLMTPLAEGVLEQPVPRDLDLRVRALIIGGDRLHRRPAAGTPFRLMNHYGPAEYSVTATVVEVTPDAKAERLPTIGRPVDNTALYLLDRHLQPVPVGVPGEVYIGGVGLGRGYHRRAVLTAERFLPDPFSGEPGARLYRTGDLARYLPDGDLEFLGRLDFQVKLRGLRIELGEIEAALDQHPEVREGAVLLREDTPRQQRLVAYVVAERPEAPPEAAELRASLRQKLPEYMVPSAFVFLETLPMTANGKIDRRALPAPEERGEMRPDAMAPQNELQRRVAEVWSSILGTGEIGIHDSFFEIGGNSLLLAQAHNELRPVAPDLTLVDLFKYPTVAALAEFLGRDKTGPSAVQQSLERAAARRASASGGGETDIAVIGMALRVPGADTPERFLDNLVQGIESVQFFSRDEVLATGISSEQADHPDYVRAEGSLEGVDLFDAGFFGYNPAEVEGIDPQQRIFLECAWEALERAGYVSERYPGTIGIFGGVNISSYLFSNLYNHDPLEVMSNFLVRVGLLAGNQVDFLCTRIAYLLNLRGPSLSVQTACSSSLVSVHLACQSLLRHECDMSLAGGVQIRVPQRMGYLYQEGGFPSPDGHCRSFDARAQGNVHGNGAGIVLLKRLSDALRDGDHVSAVIKGSAVNNDGNLKVGFSAPGVDGQARAAAEALAVAGVHPESIGYLEASGTATELGDPIEIAALTQAFRLSTDKRGFCPIGSVKSNIGHLDVASGAAALAKTVLSLEHEVILPSLHYESPNPNIDFENSPFFVNTELQPWPRGEEPRRAAIHSYAVGGTNAHLILEEAPAPEPSAPSRPWQLVPLSARTSTALHAATVRLEEHLAARPGLHLADAAFTLQVGRRPFPVRRVAVCRNDREDALSVLRGGDPDRLLTGMAPTAERSVAFLFPAEAPTGWWAQAAELYRDEPGFRDELDRCAEPLRSRAGIDLGSLLAADGEAVRDPRVAEPLLFAVEYALARLWMEWGLTPREMLGAGIGEAVAACLAGALPLADALALAAARGKVLRILPAGARLEVWTSEEEIAPLLGGEDTALEAVVAPGVCHVRGEAGAVERLQDRLNEEGIDCLHLGAAPALPGPEHPAIEAFTREVAGLAFAPPSRSFLSSRTGAPAGPEVATAAWWVRQLVEPARLDAGLVTLQGDASLVPLEVGPGEAGPLPAQARLLHDLGRLWLAGVEVDWAALSRRERRLRVPLPTYPFERTRIWAEPKIDRLVALQRLASPVDKLPVSDWFYAPSWKRSEQPASPISAASPREPGTWLVFCNGGPMGDLGGIGGIGDELVRRLRREGRDVVAVRAGGGYERFGTDDFRVDPRRFADTAALLGELRDEERTPVRVVHLLGLGPSRDPGPSLLEAESDEVFWSLVHLARGLAENGAGRVRLDVVTSGAQEVTGEERLDPVRAMPLALCRVLPQEMPGFFCRAIDVVAAPAASAQGVRLVRNLLDELARDLHAGEPVVAWRGAHRWVQTFERLEMSRPAGVPARLRDQGVYLITGGLRGLGMLVAEYLARTVKARLALVGDSGLPEPALWDEWLLHNGEGDSTSDKILALRRLEELGAEVLLCDADLTSPEQVRAAVDRAVERFGAVHGVLYAGGDPGPEVARAVTDLDPDFYEYRLRSRLAGLIALEEALRGRDLDFAFLAATVAAVLGGAAIAMDSAADLFLDTFAHSRGQDGGTAWTSVDWDAFHLGPEGEDGAGLPAFARTAISAREGIEAFERLLAAPTLPQVVVSTVDLPARLEVLLRRKSAAGAGQEAAGPRERPELPNPYVAPRSDLERQVAEVWSEVLRLSEVGTEDNFFDLGGNSLVGTQLVSRLRGTFQVDLALQDFFEGASVASVAESIQVARWAREAQREGAGVLVTSGEDEELGQI